jgi:hypothetical protein
MPAKPKAERSPTTATRSQLLERRSLFTAIPIWWVGCGATLSRPASGRTGGRKNPRAPSGSMGCDWSSRA